MCASQSTTNQKQRRTSTVKVLSMSNLGNVNTFTITADAEGRFNSQYPIFLQGSNITPQEYTQTVGHASSILEDKMKKMKQAMVIYIIGIMSLTFLSILVIIVLSLTIIGLVCIPCVIIVIFAPVIFFILYLSKVKKSLRTELYDFIQEENMRYTPRGIQFILAIRAAFNQEMYDLQVIVMGRQQQQQPQVQIQQMPQMQQNFMYQKAAPVSMQPSVPSYTPQN